MRWLEIYVPEPGWVCMRRSDGRFGEISVKLIDYDFAKYGSAEERKRLLSRWTTEVKGAPR